MGSRRRAALDLPDPDDTPFLEVALTGHVDALITGHARHFHP
jgi:predicted nucleic acid-binding protein